MKLFHIFFFIIIIIVVVVVAISICIIIIIVLWSIENNKTNKENIWHPHDAALWLTEIWSGTLQMMEGKWRGGSWL